MFHHGRSGRVHGAPERAEVELRCIVHPFERRPSRALLPMSSTVAMRGGRLTGSAEDREPFFEP
jgi:hypothetical protein